MDERNQSEYSAAGVEVRHWDGHIDEVVARGVDVHLEYMDDNSVWMSIGDVHVNLHSRGHIVTSAEEQSGKQPHVSVGFDRVQEHFKRKRKSKAASTEPST